MYYYIINPAAGGGKINKIQEKLRARLKELGIAGEFVKSTGPGDILKLTKMAIEKGFNTIVAVGGDGTISEVINSITNTNVALGIIPMGNTNELAELLGIGDWQSACSILAARKIEVVDLGQIGEKHFVTSASIGFDTTLCDVNKYQIKGILGKASYISRLSKAARLFKPVELELKFAENFTVNLECFNFIISNGAFIDYMPQGTQPQDGLLDAIAINKLSFREAVDYGLGKHDFSKNMNKLSVFHTKKVTINTPKPVPVSADGQVIAETPVTIEVSDKKIKVIVSRKRHF